MTNLIKPVFGFETFLDNNLVNYVNSITITFFFELHIYTLG